MSRGKYVKWRTQEGLTRLSELAASHTDEEMIAAMGVSSASFYAWRLKYPEIEQAITEGRSGALAAANNAAVESSLLERCLGGVHQVRKAIKIRTVEYDEATGRRLRETEKIETAIEEVYVPADTQAIRFWLTNRAGDRWKNRAELSADPKTAGGIEEFLKSVEEGGREF